MKKNVIIVLGSLLFLAAFFVFALGSIVEHAVAVTEEPSLIEAGYVPAAKCGRPQTVTVVEPVSLGVGQDRLALVPAAGPAVIGGEAGQAIAVVTVLNKAASPLAAPVSAATETAPARQILLEPATIQPSTPGSLLSTPGLQADGPVSRSSDSRLYHLRVQVINAEASGQELPYPGVVRNLMSLFFDWEPGDEPVQPVAPAV
jgi:hypothetical protein